MRTFLLLLALLLGVSKALTPAAPPKAEAPLVLTIRQTIGMTPFTLRVKVRASAEGREVCVVVEGPESFQSCRQLWGVTWTQDLTLRSGGCYETYAASGAYRTPSVRLHVIGLGEDDCDLH